MEKLNLTYNKILDNKSVRSWDIRIAEQIGNLDAALLYGQIAHHHKYLGDFSKSNEELAQELNFNLTTFRRLKKLLINKGFICVQNGGKNKSIYSIVKKLDYCKKSYRRYDVNYGVINKDINAGILLSQLIYSYEHFLEKGHTEFFKTNECLMKELFLSFKEFKRAKKKLVENSFVTARIGQHGRTYYTVNMKEIKEAVNLIPQHLSSVKRDCATCPKGTAQHVQKGLRNMSKRDHIDNKEDNINTIYLANAHTREAIKTDTDPGLDRQIKEKDFRDEQPMKAQDHPETPREVVRRPSIGVAVYPVPNPQQLSVEPPKEVMEGKQQVTKGEKKMEENEEDIVKMIEIWNKTIKKDKVNPVLLVSAFKENMREILESKFDNCLDTWQEYCTHISLDEFRMGKKPGKDGGFFNINLTWALKDESINNNLLVVMDKKKTKTPPKNITPSKEFLIQEVLASCDDEWLKKIKVVLIDYMSHARKDYGLQSYQSYLRDATFEASVINGKRQLTITSSYNAYNGLLVYDELMANAFEDFDTVILFENSSKHFLRMERKSLNVPNPAKIWEKICLEYGAQYIIPLEQRNKIAVGMR